MHERILEEPRPTVLKMIPYKMIKTAWNTLRYKDGKLTLGLQKRYFRTLNIILEGKEEERVRGC